MPLGGGAGWVGPALAGEPGRGAPWSPPHRGWGRSYSELKPS